MCYLVLSFRDDKTARNNLKPGKKTGRERVCVEGNGGTGWVVGAANLGRIVEKCLPDKVKCEERTEDDEK